jgi:hypothetical protein
MGGCQCFYGLDSWVSDDVKIGAVGTAAFKLEPYHDNTILTW